MNQYKHLFFDLDRTLWDFDKNSEATLNELFIKFVQPNNLETNFQDFLDIYRDINHQLWEDYRQGVISKEYLNVERFRKTLIELGISELRFVAEMADYYVEESPKKTLLFPFTIELLTYLQKKYTLHIITNGFEEIQFRKLKNSNLEQYFKCVITSEAAGAKKPDAQIFEFALNCAGAKSAESLMIGDDVEVDILGAQNCGIDTIFVDYFKEGFRQNIGRSVNSLEEIFEIL